MASRRVGKRGIVSIWMILGAIGVLSCAEGAPTAPHDVHADLALSVPDRALFGVGATLQLSSMLTAGGDVTDVTAESAWSSDAPGVVTVDGTGLATAVTEGTARISARFDGSEVSEQLWVVRDLEGIIAVTGVTVFAMDGNPPAPDQTVIVSDGVIAAIGPSASVPLPPEAHVVDGRDRFLIPGITDAHTHPEEESDFLSYLANGVTSIISLGHHAGAPVLTWRDRIAAGSLLGPTVYTTGRILDGAQPRGRATIVTTPDEGRAAVREQVGLGVDFIKVYNSLEVPVFEAIMDEASSLGVGVIGHGVRAPGFQGILDGGVAAIAHMEEIFYTHFASSVDPARIPSAVAALREAGTWVMPNLSTFERVSQQWGQPSVLEGWLASAQGRYISPERGMAWRSFHTNVYASRTGSVVPVLDFLRDLTGAVHEGGVPFLLATDSPIIPGMFAGWSIHDDLRLLVSAGLTPTEALEVGTRNGGAFVAAHRPGSEVFGTVTIGARADLVLLDSDPTVSLHTLERPAGVMVRGRYLSRHRLEQLLEDLGRAWYDS